MDISLFSKPSGQLVSIKDGRDHAFVPDPLPRDWVPPPHLMKLWVDAREVLGELKGTGRSLPDHTLVLRPLRQREALRSARLEGALATPTELMAYELDPRDPQSSKEPANLWRKVFNYHKTLDLGQKLVEDGYPFSERLICQLHEQLFVGVRGKRRISGKFRKK